jgi:phage terminase large subunit GpA-like protein
MMDTQELEALTPTGVCRGTCPSCGQETTLTFVGEQRWPDQVAQAMGMDPVVALWDCGHCRTTITETSLLR